jgi:excisionase family DNA binding protein
MRSPLATDTQSPFAVSPGRAAELLDCSRGTIYNLIARGELPSFLVGTCRRIKLQAIREYIARQEAREEAS